MNFHTQEETLDPDNWDEMTALGTRMVKDMMQHLENIRQLDTVFPTEEAIQNIGC